MASQVPLSVLLSMKDEFTQPLSAAQREAQGFDATITKASAGLSAFDRLMVTAAENAKLTALRAKDAAAGFSLVGAEAEKAGAKAERFLRLAKQAPASVVAPAAVMQSALASSALAAGATRAPTPSAGAGMTMAGALGGLRGVAGALGITVGAATITNLARSAMEAGFNIERMAKMTGVTTDEWQSLADAVEDTGGDISALVQGFNRIKDLQGSMARGDADALKKGAAIGITAGDAPAQALLKIAQAGKDAGWSGERFAAISDVLSLRTLPQLQAALAELADKGYGGLQAAMRANGEWLSNTADLAAARKELKDFGDQSVVVTGNVLSFTRRLAELAAAASALSRGDVDLARALWNGGVTTPSGGAVKPSSAAPTPEPFGPKLPGEKEREAGNKAAADLQRDVAEERRKRAGIGSPEDERAGIRGRLRELGSANITAAEMREREKLLSELKRLNQQELEARSRQGAQDVEAFNRKREADGELAQRGKSIVDKYAAEETRLKDKALPETVRAQADAYAQIGGRVGGQIDPQIRVLDRQAQLAERMADIQARMLNELIELNGGEA